jgi:hypothetical protein
MSLPPIRSDAVEVGNQFCDVKLHAILIVVALEEREKLDAV